MIIDQISTKNIGKDSQKKLLKQAKNFWILKLDKLKPKRLN